MGNTAGTYSKGCVRCSSGYKGNGTNPDAQFGTSTACVAGTIANCDRGSTFDNSECQMCKPDYAVASNSKSCVSFTTDSNCYLLGTTNDFCYKCWFAYYFDGKTCVLAG